VSPLKTGRGSPVLLLHSDPHWRTLLLLLRRLLVKAEPRDGLELAGEGSLGLVVAVPDSLLLPGPGHPPVALVVGRRSGHLHPGTLPAWGGGRAGGAGGAGGAGEFWFW